MFQPWRLKIRAAEAAYRGGRLDEAGRLLAEDDLTDFLPGRKLSEKVAEGMVARAESLAASGDTSAGWQSLEQAAALVSDSPRLHEVQETLLARGLQDVEDYLEADQPREAIARLEQLARRHEPTQPMRLLGQVARRLEKVQDLSRQGKFADALHELESAAALRDDLSLLGRRDQLHTSRVESRRLRNEMHQALCREDWPVVLETAESLLELAPDNREARSAQRQAWAAAGIRHTQTNYREAPQRRPDAARRSTHHKPSSAKVDTVTSRTPGKRFLMWVDAVGGFLVCLGDEIVLGPPTAEAAADVPILGDLSRRHAVIRRDGEGYLIEAVRDVKLDGRPVDGVAALSDGSLIALGDSVEIRFRRPHSLSGTARLDFVSRHKTEPTADAVLLMAESCVLGPKSHSHVVCRDWPQDVVLFRQGEELYCRSEQSLTVGGVEGDGARPVELNTRIEGEEFSIALEEV